MSRAMRIHRYGGPEELIEETLPDTPPKAGEIRIRQRAIGVNFTDTHARRGDYAESKALTAPVAIGMEAMGVVEALGAGVTRQGCTHSCGFRGDALPAYIR